MKYKRTEKKPKNYQTSDDEVIQQSLYDSYLAECQIIKNTDNITDFENSLNNLTDYFNKFENSNINYSPLLHLYEANQIHFILANKLEKIFSIDSIIIHLNHLVNFSPFAKLYQNSPICQILFDILLKNNYSRENSSMLSSIIIYFVSLQMPPIVYSFILENFQEIIQSIFNTTSSSLTVFMFIKPIISSDYVSIEAYPMITDCINFYLDNYPFDNRIRFCVIKIFKLMLKRSEETFDYIDKHNLLSFLLERPTEDTEKLQRARIKFLITLLKCNFHRETYLYTLSPDNCFDFSIIIEIRDKLDSALLEVALELLSSFLPQLVDVLCDKLKPDELIGFVLTILTEGKMIEKVKSLVFLKNLLMADNISFVMRNILKNDDFFEGIIEILNTDDLELVSLGLEIVKSLIDNIRNFKYRNEFASKFDENSFQEVITQIMDNENKEIAQQAMDISAELNTLE